MDNNTTYNKERLELVDSLRGATIISMILFHACWFASYFGLFITWDQIFSNAFIIWERSICISFIFISGFVFSIGKRHLRNGLLITGLGVGITILSLIFMYDIRDVFGVLWVLGISSLVLIIPNRYWLDKLLASKILSISLFVFSTVLFVATYNINKGYLGAGNMTYYLNRELYKGSVMTFLGFTDPQFYSVDYFSFIPWFFMYLMGYFCQKIIYGSVFYKKVLTIRIPVLNTIGKHSLIIYLVHPVVLFAVLFILQKIMA